MSVDLGETEEAIVLATAVAGIAKPVPAQNKSETCRSCGEKIVNLHCGACGQKNDDLRRSLWRLIGEALDGVFSFESRLWRTWATLIFKPGKVAREYADGARTRFSPPARVYIVVSFLFFTFMAFSSIQFMAFHVTKTDVPLTPAEISTLSPDDKYIDRSTEIPTRPEFSFGLRMFQPESELPNLSAQDIEQLVTSMDADGGLKITIARQTISPQILIDKFVTNPREFNATFNTWLPRTMFFMLPLAMIFGWLFLRGPNALLYDHLIHAFYVHSVFFIAVFAAVISALFLPGNWVFLTLVTGLLIYYPISIKRMFGRGWIKTIWTFLGTSFVYFFFLAIALTAITALSASSVVSNISA